jgi:multimeric flavodoxin WrbA
LATEAADAIEDADVRIHFLNGLDFRDCTGCHLCKKGVACPLNDDLTPVLEDVRDCDALIVATPVYFGRATGLYCQYEDRTFRLYSEQPDPPARKALVIVSSGAPTEFGKPTAERIQRILTRRNFDTSIILHSTSDSPSPKEDPELMELARQEGRRLLQSR